MRAFSLLHQVGHGIAYLWVYLCICFISQDRTSVGRHVFILLLLFFCIICTTSVACWPGCRHHTHAHTLAYAAIITGIVVYPAAACLVGMRFSFPHFLMALIRFLSTRLGKRRHVLGTQGSTAAQSPCSILEIHRKAISLHSKGL